MSSILANVQYYDLICTLYICFKFTISESGLKNICGRTDSDLEKFVIHVFNEDAYISFRLLIGFGYNSCYINVYILRIYPIKQPEDCRKSKHVL